jgi:hypothetical protein
VVSITTRSKSSSPLRRFSARSAAWCAGLRDVQHTQPLFQLDDLFLAVLHQDLVSMFSSPNSFSITAIFWPWDSVSTRLSSVV